MEGLRPPLVALDAEAGDGGGVVHEQPDLLGQGEPRDEVPDPDLYGPVGPAKWIVVGIAGARERRPSFGGGND